MVLNLDTLSKVKKFVMNSSRIFENVWSFSFKDGSTSTHVKLNSSNNKSPYPADGSKIWLFVVLKINERTHFLRSVLVVKY